MPIFVTTVSLRTELRSGAEQRDGVEATAAVAAPGANTRVLLEEEEEARLWKK